MIDNLEKIKILVVEDNEEIRGTYLRLLKMFNFDVFEASNGQEGIENYKKNLPDVVITDIQMPIMDGFRLIEEIKKIDENVDIIIISAFEDIDILHKAIDLDILQFIKKPIDVEKFKKAIYKLIKNINNKKSLKVEKKNLEDIVKAEIEKNREKENLMFQQSRYAQMGEMLSMIAHQWRQPLNAISASVMNIEIENSLEELTDESLNSNITFIHNQIQNMSNIINDFMNFFKVEKDKTEFNVSSLMKEIDELIGAQFKSRGIELISTLKEDLTVKSYKKEIIHILINLIINSRDAFEEMVDIKKNRVVVFDFKDGGESFEITLSDNAGGIPDGIINRVFEPYFTTKEQGKGTGIGLYMTKSIIEKNLNGKISVENIENENGKGVCFTIEIPKG